MTGRPIAGRPATPTWLRTVITGVFALLYAYAVWNAIGNLVQVVQALPAHTALNATGWFLWLFAAALPVIVFAVALGVCWQRRAFAMLLVMFTGLTVVGVFWLDVQGYAVLHTAALLTT